MSLRVTIAGDIGSGKTTAATRLAAMTGIEWLSTGGIQRRMAAARGMTTLELNKAAEADPRIDREIDQFLADLSGDPVIVESRMAWRFVPDTLKVYLYVTDAEAARRVTAAERADERYVGAVESSIQILSRRQSEVSRFARIYDVDIEDLANYDLVIDTTFSDAADVTEIIAHYAGQPPERALCFLSPKNMVPTKAVRPDRLEELAGRVKAHDFEASSPISLVSVGHVFFILDGHARAGAAIRAGIPLIPAIIVASDDEPAEGGRSARELVEASVTDALAHDFESVVGFRYADKLWEQRRPQPLKAR